MSQVRPRLSIVRQVDGSSMSLGDVSYLPGADPSPTTAQAELRLAIPDAVRYRPLQLLGRGGMGHVMEVFDARLGRHVALKHRRPDTPRGAILDRQLARETTITARLNHPGIVPILDAGIGPDGHLYYTMPIVHGQPLSVALSLAAGGDERLRLLRRVLEACEAVAWAHRQRVAHGDLKPSNIMLVEGGGTRVLDWGLARVLDEDTTTTGGTPQYMSPEQAHGALADERSDVWSLGAILFEVCAGRPLRSAGTRHDVLEGARAETDLAQLDLHLDPELAPALVTIIRRALAPDRGDRYPDARALAEDLASFLDGRRVTAHQYTARELLGRFVRAWRLPLAVIAGALVVIAILVAIGMARLDQEAEVAALARDRAEASEAHARTAFNAASRDLGRSLVTQALMRSDQGARAEAEVLATHALLHAESPRARGVLAAWGAAAPPELVSRSALPPCLGVALSEAGDLLLCREHEALSAWALSPHTSPALRWRRPGPVRVMAASSDVIAAFTSSLDLVLLDPRDGALLSEHTVSCETRLMAYGRRVIAANNGCFWAHVIDDGASPITHPCLGRLMGAFAADPGRERWTALCEDGTLVQGHFGDATTTETPTALAGLRLALAAAFFGEHLLVGTGDGDLVLLDPATGAPLSTLASGFPKILDLAVAPDRRHALVRASDGRVALFSPAGELSLGRLPERAARLAAFVGGELLVVSDDIDRYRLAPSTPHAFFLDSGVTAIAFDPRGTAIAATSGYRIEARSLTDGALLLRAPAGDSFIKTSAFTATGTHLLVGFASRRPGAPMRLKRFETETWQELPPLPRPNNARRIAARSDGTFIEVPYFSGLHITTDDGLSDPHMVDPDGQRYADVTSSPDARFSVALGEDDRRILRFVPGVLEPERIGHDPRAIAVAIARDGVLVASAGEGGLSLWDADAFALTGLIELPGTSITRVAISPDMRWLAAGARDGRIWIWDLGPRRLVATLQAHKERISALAFSPDARLLATGSWDGWVRLLALDRLTTPAAPLVDELESTWALRLTDVLDADTDLTP